MRVQKLSVLAVAVAAGLSLTACQGGDSSSSSESASQSSGGNSPGTGSDGGPDSGSESGSDANGGGTDSGSADPSAPSDSCKTSQLGFSSSHGMAEGELLINLKNNGSAPCSLQGFPGVDLKGKDGTLSATRSKLGPSKVTIKPGDETRFTLHYPPDTSGGTGSTFTTLTITPPNETHAHSLPTTINLPVSDSSTSSVTVDPVGAGK